MGTFNKIVISLVAILAIATAGIGYFLFEKREELVKGWEKYGSTVSTAARTLDKKSGTNVAGSVSSSNLHHSKYKELEGNLKKFADQVKKYSEQREALANTVMSLSKDLELSGKFNAKNFSNVKKYNQFKTDVEKAGANALKINNSIYNAFVATANSIGHTALTKERMKGGNYISELNKVTTKAKNVKKRQDGYGNSLKKIASNIGLSDINLLQNDFASELTNIENASMILKKNYNDKTMRLNTANDNINKMTQRNADLSAENTIQQTKIDDLQKQVNTLIGISGSSSIVWVPGSPSVLQRAKGKIIEVNKKWNYVVIDIGYDTTVVQNINGKPFNIATMLKVGYSLVVARDIEKNPKDAYVGKINLTKVDPYCAIADIDADTIKDIKKGDIVFFSDKFIKDLRQKNLDEAKARIDIAVKKANEANKGMSVDVPEALTSDSDSKKSKNKKPSEDEDPFTTEGDEF